MSGHLCSIAWPVFFARLAVPDEEPMQSRFSDHDARGTKRIAQFEQGSVAVFGQPCHDRFAMGLCLAGISVPAKRTGPQISLAQLQISSAADACGTHAEPFGSFTVGRASTNGTKNTNTQIDRRGSRHIRRPPSADSLNQTAPDLPSHGFSQSGNRSNPLNLRIVRKSGFRLFDNPMRRSKNRDHRTLRINRPMITARTVSSSVGPARHGRKTGSVPEW